MTENTYGLIDAVVIEPGASAIRWMRDALGHMGVRKTHPFQSLKGSSEQIVSLTPDLIIVDIDAPEIDGFKFIHWVRSDPVYPNPFVCIIATTWHPTASLLQKVDNSGADALLVKPFSPKQIMDQLHHLIEARKRFVVSTDYIGPDRRKNPRDDPEIPTLEAPNTLRLKVSGHWDTNTARDLLAKGIGWLSEHKAQRDAFQIAFLLEYAKPGLLTHPPDRIAFLHALKVGALVDDMVKRLITRDHDPNLETTCKALLTLIERIRRKPETAAASADMEQLHTLSFRLAQAIEPSRTLEQLTHQIAESTVDYRARMECLKATKAQSAINGPAKPSH